MGSSALSGLERVGVFVGGCGKQAINENKQQTYNNKTLHQADTLVYMKNNNNNIYNSNNDEKIIDNKDGRKETFSIKAGTLYGPYKGRMMGVSEMRSVDDNNYMWEIFNTDGQLSHFINVSLPNLSYPDSKYKNKKDINETKKRSDSDLMRNIIKLPQENNLKRENETSCSKKTHSLISSYNTMTRNNQDIKIEKNNNLPKHENDDKPETKIIEILNKTSTNSHISVKNCPIYEEAKQNEKNAIIRPNNTWMAVVNCARSPNEQNVKAIQRNGAIYFEVTKDIEEGDELLVWYDDDTYLQFLGVPIAVKSQTESKVSLHNDNIDKEENMFNLEKESKLL